MNDSDEYIDFNDVLNTFQIHDSEIKEIKEINETNKEQKLYQVQGQDNESCIILQYLGYNPDNDRPCYVLQEFDFKTYKCKIISYILSDIDINYAHDTCELKMLSLLITKNDVVIAAITLSFYTFEHKKNKQHINEFISDNNKIKINGFFQFNLICNDNSTKEKIGEIMYKYKGTSKSVYMLIELLSHDKLNKLWLK